MMGALRITVRRRCGRRNSFIYEPLRWGVDSYLQVVTSQTASLSNERNDIDIRRRQLDASVLLIKTLGGDWNVNKLPKV
jgi:outer membrane protein TolC